MQQRCDLQGPNTEIPSAHSVAANYTLCWPRLDLFRPKLFISHAIATLSETDYVFHGWDVSNALTVSKSSARNGPTVMDAKITRGVKPARSEHGFYRCTRPMTMLPEATASGRRN